MHNLAVLYAEGIDGKPDYKVAAQWFRRRRCYGVTDSQYNLAILYARGIGIAGQSRRILPLVRAGRRQRRQRSRQEARRGRGPARSSRRWRRPRLAAQGFTPEREPDEAINLKAPPGGWDKAPAAQAKPRRKRRRRRKTTRLRQYGDLNNAVSVALLRNCVDIRAIEPIPKGSELPRRA